MLKDFYNQGRIEDPAFIGISCFDVREDFGALEGTRPQFKRRNFLILTFIVIFKCLFVEYIPTLIDVILTGLVIYFVMEGLFVLFSSVNRGVKARGLISLIVWPVILLIFIFALNIIV